MGPVWKVILIPPSILYMCLPTIVITHYLRSWYVVHLEPQKGQCDDGSNLGTINFYFFFFFTINICIKSLV